MFSRIRGALGSRPYLYAVLSGAFIVVCVIDVVVAKIHLRPEVTIVDDLLLAVLTAVLVISLEKQHQREMRQQQNRISVIVEMNHHIRNALQSIVYASAQMDGEKAAVIRDASKRIEWALKEVLPGEGPPVSKPPAVLTRPPGT